MRMLRKANRLGIGLLMAGTAHAAIAQDQADGPEPDDGNVIIVTAQFIAQDVQDTPIAITVLTGDALADRGIDSTALIGATSPNVQLQQGPSSQGNSLIAFIRGIGQQDNSPTLEPGVGIYINDVYISNVQGALLELLDIDRVEILRGPQGTLTGKNSIGGAIRMFSKRPDDDTDGMIEASYGNFNAFRLRAGANLTLAPDQLYARVSGSVNRRDGYVDNFDFGCLYPGSGVPAGPTGPDCRDGTLGGVETYAVRGALRWIASDNVEINLSADYIDDRSDPPANILTGVGPTVAPVFFAPPSAANPLPLAWPWLNTGTNPPTLFNSALNPCVFVTIANGQNCPNIQQALGGPVVNDGFSSFSSFFDGQSGFAAPRVNTNESLTLAGNIDWDITPDLQLQSITAYRQYDILIGSDDDATPVSLSTQSNVQSHEAFSQELRLNGVAGNLSYTVGGFYQDSRTDIGGRVILRNAALDFNLEDRVDFTSWALFANAIWDISDQLQLAGGVRYSNDDKTFGFIRSNPDGTAPVACAVITLPDGTQVVDPTSSPNCLVGGINDTPPQVFAQDRVDFRAALSYLATDDITLYASIASGYKAGGANSRPFFAAQIQPHDSESVVSYEVGSKMQLFDRRLRLNLSAFRNDYKDIIVTLFNCEGITGAPFGSPCFLPVNGGEARVTGFEAEASWSVTDNFTIDGSFATIDFDYTSVNPASGLTTDTTQPYTPDVTWYLGAEYFVDTGIGRFTARLDATYQDDMFTQPENTPFSLIEARTLVNGLLRWTSEDGNWAVTLEGRNLTDEYYFFNATDFIGGLNGYATANPGLPRTWTLGLRRNF